MGSNDRVKVISMFAAVVVLAAGGMFWFFKIHQPGTRMDDARAEVIGWDVRWIEARKCLLGEAPGSAKVSEALAMRELSTDPFERKTCTQLISQLSRGEAEDTRVSAVEEQWRVLDKAASKVAVSFISHVDPGGDGMRKKPDPLNVALDELETAYAGLRKAAGMEPSKPILDKKPLPAAVIVPVKHGDKRVLSVQEPYVTSRAGLLSFGTIDGSEIQLQFATGKPPVISAVGAGMQRAIPDGNWAARALPDGIEVGQVDVAGALPSPAKLALPGATQVLAVVGTWADGVVIYGAGNQLVVARGKNGTFTPEKPITVRSTAFATDAATGYTTLAYTDDKTSEMWALHLDPSALDITPDDLGQPGFPKLMCLAADSTWVQYTSESGVHTMELRKGTHAEVPDDEKHLMGCSPGGAVLFDFGDEPFYRRCSQGACEAAAPRAGAVPSRFPVAVVPNGVVGVEARGPVLAVRKGGPTDHYAVPNGFVPLVAMTDGNTLDVLGWDADGLVIARVSAR